MPITMITTRYGGAALQALLEVVTEAKRDDPMRTVTVLVPDNLSGTVARRHLARSLRRTTGVAGGGCGVAGLHLATVTRLAETLAAPTLAPRRPATAALVAACWRSALRHRHDNTDPDAGHRDSDGSGVFDDVRDHPATVQALVRAHGELRDLSSGALDTIAACSELTSELVRLHRQVVQRLAGDWYDATDLLLAAADLVERDPASARRLGTLVVYLPQHTRRSERALVSALAGSLETTAVVGLTSVKRADRQIVTSIEETLQQTAGGPFAIGSDEPRTALEVRHASDADDEVRCVVREVLATLSTTPGHRVSVLYAAALPYARLLHEHFAAAKIAVNGPGTRPVIERSLARGFLDVLRLSAADLSRAALFTAVSETPTRTFDGARLPTARWERLSRTAGVVSGADWERRLTTLADRQRAELARLAESAPDRAHDRSRSAEPVQRGLDEIERLAAFVSTLRARLEEAGRQKTWAALADWARGLFTDLYGEADMLTALPAEEQYAAAVVLTSIDDLSELDALHDGAGSETGPGLELLIEALSTTLESALPRVGSFGEGVLVAPLSESIGLDADEVYVVGLAEDAYPGRMREDPLLLDAVREASGGDLTTYRDRIGALQRQLLAAYDAAPRVVASFPRGDLRRSTERLPSRWLLPSLRRLADDKALPATQWQRVTSPLLLGSPSYATSLLTATLPASGQEWRTRASAAGLLVDHVTTHGREVIHARAGDDFTRFDGNLAGVAGLPDFGSGVGSVAPTTLESFADCPHAYFVARLLKVRPVEQPEELVSISPLDVGNLIHETMDAFISSCGDALPGYGEPWTSDHRQALRAIASDTADTFRARGATGHERLWEAERDRILADVDSMLDLDDERRAKRDARVVGSELAFGVGDHPPVPIEIDGGTVLMRGSADLVEQTRDQTVLVIDIKTGGTSRYQPIRSDPLVRGTKLQLPVYARAARAVIGGRTVEAAYWFVRRGKRGWIDLTLTDELDTAYSAAVGTLVGAIAAGRFPQKPPETPDYGWVRCSYCNPDGIGHGEARARWERKRRAPQLRELVALIDPEAL